MSGFTVSRLRNPDALDLPAVKELFERAFDYEHFPDADEVREWCRDRISDEKVGVFVARNSESFVGMTIVNADTAVWNPTPQGYHFWAPAMPDVRVALLHEIISFLKEHGKQKIWVLNQSPLPDDEYVRSFTERQPGFSGAYRCSLMEFTISDGGDENG